MVRDTILNPWSSALWSISKENISVLLPKITIGILNYNRGDDLRRTLECLTKGIQYPDFEIIMVDNASHDGSVEMVSEEFPEVKIIRLEKNIGAAGRNYFYHAAKGKYVFSFDDDSFPATPSTIYRAVSFLQGNEYIDSLTMYYYQPLTGVIETGESEEICFSYTSSGDKFGHLFFAEGGMCIKTSSFLKLKGYDPDFIVYGEGLDLTLQMYKLGMHFVYHPGIATLHMKSAINRRTDFTIRQQTRNTIWTLLKHFPLYAFFPLFFLFFFRQCISIVLHPGRFRSYYKGFLEGIQTASFQRRKTAKLNLRQVLGLKRWYLMLFRY